MQIDIHAIQIDELIPIDLLTNIASTLFVSVLLLNQAQAEKCRELTHKQAETNNSKQQVSRASKIMGTVVRASNGDALCGIKDLVLNPENDQVIYAVVTFGGVMGLVKKLFVIPWQTLHWIPGEELYDPNVDKATLMTARRIDQSHWLDISNLQREGIIRWLVSPTKDLANQSIRFQT